MMVFGQAVVVTDMAAAAIGTEPMVVIVDMVVGAVAVASVASLVAYC